MNTATQPASSTPDPAALTAEVVAALRQENASLKASLAAAEEALASTQANLAATEERLAEALASAETLQSQVDNLTRQLFGRSSEKRPGEAPPDQPLLTGFNEVSLTSEAPPAEPASAPAPAQPKARKPYTPRRLILEGLERRVEQITPPEVLADPTAWRLIGSEITNLLERDPARFYVRSIERQKYVPAQPLGEDEAPKAAAPILPELQILIPGSYLGASMAAHIAVSRFCDHLPYYRQAAILAREGMAIPASQLGSWMAKLAALWLVRLAGLIFAHVLAAPVIGADETPIKYLPEKQKKKKGAPDSGPAPPGQDPPLPEDPPTDAEPPLAATAAPRQTKQGYFWVFQRPGEAVCFRWNTSRSAEALASMLPGDWNGTLVTDDYATYSSEQARRAATLKKRHTGPQLGQITRAACMAHVRRKFVDIEKQHPSDAARILGQIQKLYQIEAKLRSANATPEQIKAQRQDQGKKELETLKSMLTAIKDRPGLLPKSSLTQAVNYALNQLPDFQAYLENPLVPLDNNGTERAIRPTAVGKKNWLFLGRAESGHTAAIYYSLLETAKLHGLNPEKYLTDLLNAVPSMADSQLPNWTPWAYAAREKEAKAKQAEREQAAEAARRASEEPGESAAA